MTVYEDAAATIQEVLRTEVVLVEGVFRLRPATDEAIALNIMEALVAAGFQVVRIGQSHP